MCVQCIKLHRYSHIQILLLFFCEKGCNHVLDESKHSTPLSNIIESPRT